jgi:hypothetical protein
MKDDQQQEQNVHAQEIQVETHTFIFRIEIQNVHVKVDRKECEKNEKHVLIVPVLMAVDKVRQTARDN